MRRKNLKYVYEGTITFNTDQTLEQPYREELERKIGEFIAKYLKEYDVKFAKKKFCVNIKTYRMEC